MTAALVPERLLEVGNLKKHFPIRKGFIQRIVGMVRAVDDVSFHINSGETLALVGESGCGKTTASRCVVRALDPTSGRIVFRGGKGETVDLATLPQSRLKATRRHLQMIFQDPFSSLNPRMSLFDLVGEPLLNYGMRSRSEREARVADLLSRVGLRPEYMQRFPHAFSGGQRQRIGIARALALNPKLIVADEAVSALDVSVQAQVLNLLADLREQLGLAYLFVAHDLSVVKQFSHRVAVMYVGRIVETAPTTELFENPKHPYTEALLSAVPIADPRIRHQRVPLEGGGREPRQSAEGLPLPPALPLRHRSLPQRDPGADRSRTRTRRSLPLRKDIEPSGRHRLAGRPRTLRP